MHQFFNNIHGKLFSHGISQKSILDLISYPSACDFFFFFLMASSPSDNSFSLNTLIHMLTIKLNSSNYLLWKNQITPLLRHQRWISHVDGSANLPPSKITVNGKETANPDLDSWIDLDQKVLLILQSSLS